MLHRSVYEGAKMPSAEIWFMTFACVNEGGGGESTYDALAPLHIDGEDFLAHFWLAAERMNIRK